MNVPNDINSPNLSPLSGGTLQDEHLHRGITIHGTKKESQKMKKIIGSMGLAMFLALVSSDLSAADCSHGFAELGLKSHDETGSTRQAGCADEEVFKGVFRVPAGVPLFLSAIAGLGVVALRGRTAR